MMRVPSPTAAASFLAIALLLASAPRAGATGSSTGSEEGYSVVVSIADQRTYVYEGGRLARSMRCSTGIVDGENDTPLGDYIIDESGALTAMVHAAMTKSAVPAWLSSRFPSFKQKYSLSCEIALIRTALALFGLDASEDEILSTIPRSGRDPEKAFVCDDIDGGRRLNGKILWDNYGTHPPVVAAEIDRRLAAAGLDGAYEAVEEGADDAALRSIISENAGFLGAIIWLVGHPERWGEKPPVNDRGMVLGEHVRFLEPRLSPKGEFRIWDPETGKLIVSASSGSGRELFRYRIVALYATSADARSTGP
jgi:hypothetical protein